MKIELTTEQKERQEQFRAFVNREIMPYADQYHREERTPPEVVEKLAQQGYLGLILPAEYGGGGIDMVTYGLLMEEFGRGCSSLRSLLTVQGMVSHTLLKWGSKHQKERWLHQMATGEVIAAFGLSEPQAGSDAKNGEATAIRCQNGYVLNGCKKWITYGQIADVFLVFVQYEGKSTAFLVEKNAPGLSIQPIAGLLGVRASMIAELHLTDCQVPAENLVGRQGFGFSPIASLALHHGRYCVACGCVGIIQACLDACLQYTSERKQFGVYLKDHQLIRQMITEMLTNLKAARLLCYQAGYLQDSREPRAPAETSIAKYFASTAATRAANAAIQICGANGCSSDYPLQRYLGDARIMEIIEGSTQIHQLTIAEYGYQEYGPQRI